MNTLRLQVYIAFRLSCHRLAAAATTKPQWRDWGLAIVLMAAFSAVVLPLGFWSHWLTLSLATPSWTQSLRLASRVLVIPALLEEGFWRVLLLPHKTEIMSVRQRWLIGLPILLLFVLMHLVTSLTVYPAGFPTFTQPLFLFSALLLGLICTIAYWQSGSGWVSVAMHWLIVFVWLMFLGGYTRLGLA